MGAAEGKTVAGYVDKKRKDRDEEESKGAKRGEGTSVCLE